MICFWSLGFLNSDASGWGIIIMVGVACDTKLANTENLRVFNLNNLPSKKLLLNGLQYCAGIQQHFVDVAATPRHVRTRLADGLEHLDNQQPFDPRQPATLALVHLQSKKKHGNTIAIIIFFENFQKYMRAGDQKHNILSEWP